MPAVARSKPAPRSASRSHTQSKVKVQPPARGRGGGGRKAPPTTAAPRKIEVARKAGLAPQAALGAAAATILGVAALAMFTGERLETLQRGVDRTSNAAASAMGFGVETIEIRGATEPHARPAILAAAGVEPGDNILALNLPAMRNRVDAVVWVEGATIQRLLPGSVVITVKERRPQAVWQHRGRIGLVDETGRVIAGADPMQFPQLPLVVGAGANQAVSDILPVLHSRPQLVDRIEALVRVDRRRWDLRLKDGALIQLPALDEEDALMRLDQLERSARVLELGFEKIDLRDPQLVAVRPRANQPKTAGPAAPAPQSTASAPSAAAAPHTASAPAPAIPSTPAAPAASGL